MVQECIEKGNKLISYITSTVTQLPEPSKSKCLDLLEECQQQWCETSRKQERVVEYREALEEHFELKFNEIFIKIWDLSLSLPRVAIGTTFSVKVTCVKDPGEFYVVFHDTEKQLELIHSTLKEEVSSYLFLSQEAVYNEMYAVRDSLGKWIRGFCGNKCGIKGIGENPPEDLYDFYMPDQGNYESIGYSDIRILPPKLKIYPPYAIECTLADFERITWSAQKTNKFCQMTKDSSLKMKVFGVKGYVLNVDLAQPEGKIQSFRNVLMYSDTRTMTTDCKQYFKLKPRLVFPGLREGNLPEFYIVHVTCAVTPTSLYVQIIDDNYLEFKKIDKELQQIPLLPFQDACQGVVCAMKNVKEMWCRVLIEQVSEENFVVFFVDTGHRQKVPVAEKFFQLPEKFLKIPAQAVKLFLDGIVPSSNTSYELFGKKWSKDLVKSVRSRRLDGQNGIPFIKSRKFGEVGRIFDDEELKLSVVLYMHHGKESVNCQIGSKCEWARSKKVHEKRRHYEIRKRLGLFDHK